MAVRWLLVVVLATAVAAKNVCDPNPCGPHSDCYPDTDENGEEYAHCECAVPHKGNAWIGCVRELNCHCCGDPHCKTFDGAYFDYQGTCPYIYSTPCKKFNNETMDYVVKGLNKEFPSNKKVSYPSEVEVEMYDFKLHVDETLQLTVNGVKRGFPFYWPQKKRSKILAEIRGGMAYIRNEAGVTVTFYKEHLKIAMPKHPEYMGENVICGLSGNLNDDCSDDIISRNLKHTINKKPCVYAVDKKNMAKLATVLDTWITKDFTGFGPKSKCKTGADLAPALPTCSKTSKSREDCIHIKDAAEGKGIVGKGYFGLCHALGVDFLTNSYEACAFDGCVDETTRCDNLKNFAIQCQNAIGKTDLTDWREKANCPLDCSKQLKHSVYSSCVSGCQATCANPKPRVSEDDCVLPCTEGCRCKEGFLLDTTVTPHQCVKPNECPCYDDTGSAGGKEGQSWLTSNCTKKHGCVVREGKKRTITEKHECQPNSKCGVNEKGHMSCRCEPGWKQKGENECVKA